jgi:hypothetical protein
MGEMRFKLQTWLTAMFLLIASPSVFGQATELIANEGPTPTNAEDLQGPIAEAFPGEKVLPDGLWGKAAGWLKNKDPFWSDMTLSGNFRTYYFLRDNGTTGLIEENEAWAAGGTLNFETGKLWNTVSFGTEYFLSAPVDASDSTPGTGLLKPIQDTISVLGQAYIRGTFGEQIATAGRQRINKPYLNGNESRMLPNTFEAITLDGRWKSGRFFIGYVDKIKVRNSDNFISMGRRAGVMDSDEGLAELGARYEWGDGNYIGLITSVVPDILATTYSELDMRWGRGDWGFRTGAQLTDQRSIGDDFLPGGKYDTQSFGARFSASINNFIMTGVVSANGDGAAIRSPFGGDPGFTSLMLSDFNFANQKTYRLGLSYTATAFGYPGLSGFVNYAHSYDAEIAATGESLPNDEEFDITVDFRSQSGKSKAAWLRARYGVLNPGTDRERYNVRITLNWPFQFL